MLELLTILAIAVPWSLTLHFADSKHHKDINQKFTVFVTVGVLVFGLLTYFFS
jgi:hypothetical protein